jgi:hypothetical protein
VNTGDLDTLSFVNDRLFKVITIVCKQATATLYTGTNKIGDTTVSTPTSIPSTWNVTEAQLCGLTGISGLKADTATSNHSALVHFQ